MARPGERSLRRLITACSTVVQWARRKGVPATTWLGQMLARKPPMLVVVALANKTARIAWAELAKVPMTPVVGRPAKGLLAKGGVYQAPAVPA